MGRTFRPSFTGFASLFTTSLFHATARAAQEAYCSSQNTAGNDAFYWQYQSNSKCTEQCNSLGTYAFAVIQYTNCWCSNYIPQQQQNLNRCVAQGCPGFPSEHCGSLDDGTFIYIKLAGQPSGTASGPPSQQTSQEPSTSAAPPPSTQAPPSSTPPPASTSQAAPAPAPVVPVTSVQYITESGAIVTRTVVQTPSSVPSASVVPVQTGARKSGSNTAAIVGGVVGGVIGLLALVGGILFLLRRRRKQTREEYGEASTGITRNTSTMSKAGLMAGATEREPQYPPRVATNFSTQTSRYDGDQEPAPITPISNRRNSQPLIIDSRLNPNAVLTFAQANASRDSLVSMEDSRDYGRQLNVRNPDT